MRIAVRDFHVSPRKARGRNKPQRTSLSGDEQSEDGNSHRSRSNSGEPSPAPYRAPEAPNMFPAQKVTGSNSFSTDFQNADSQTCADIERNDRPSKQADTELLLRHSCPVTPAKRKQFDVQGHVSTGKLHKGLKGHTSNHYTISKATAGHILGSKVSNENIEPFTITPYVRKI